MPFFAAVRNGSNPSCRLWLVFVHIALVQSELLSRCLVVLSSQDNDAHFAMAGKYELSLKPHGHGDVHSLLHSSGLAKKWATTMGIKWIVFFQVCTVFASLLYPVLYLASRRCAGFFSGYQTHLSDLPRSFPLSTSGHQRRRVPCCPLLPWCFRFSPI